MKTYNIKPLEWIEMGNIICAIVPQGTYKIEIATSILHANLKFLHGLFILKLKDIETAKEAAEEHWTEYLVGQGLEEAILKMAYVAIDPLSDNYCYAIHLADPDAMEGFDEVLADWRCNNSIVKLLPFKEAQKLFSNKRD